MKRSYDIVYLTNTPSFYKLRLMDEVARHGRSVLLVFYGYGSEAVNTQLNEKSRWAFDFEFLHCGDAAMRSKWRTWWALCRLMRTVKAKTVLFAGWLAPEYNLYAFFSRKKRNAMVVESTIHESGVSGFSGWIKRRIVARMSRFLPSGTPHVELIKALGAKPGSWEVTGSVGLINRPKERPRVMDRRFEGEPFLSLYVGRLIDCKNLRWLIARFNASGKPLTIAGKGPLEAELKMLARPNISFVGFVENEEIGELYQSYDLLILPSYREPWGLVVDEALFWGIPVLASDRVGSAQDLLISTGAGRTFSLDDEFDFRRALASMSNNYPSYLSAVASIDFDARDAAQIAAYLHLSQE